jgi:hypothetical protein
MAIVNGRMILNRLTPAAFIAVSSNFSPRLPKVINEANNIANGNANGTTDVIAYTKNSANTLISTPLPTRSFTCIHTNCISNMNTQIKKVTMSNPMKCTNKYLSSFFNLFFS